MTRNYQLIKLTGNPKSKSGDQINNWITPSIEEAQLKMSNWDWSKPFEVEMPEKPIATVFDEALKDNNLPDKLPEELKLSLYKSSQLTDFIKGSFLEQYGFIVSEKAKKLLEQFNIGIYKFYPLTITHKELNHKNYYFLKSLTNINEFIDVSNTVFYVQEDYFNSDDREVVKFHNWDDIENFRNSGKDLYIFADKIQLRQDFPKFDLFQINDFGIYERVVSESLSKELEYLTGFDLVKSDIIA